MSKQKASRRVAAAAIALVVGVSAAACGVREGTVIDKDHDKAWTQFTTRTVYDQTNCRMVTTTTGTGTTRRTTSTQKCDQVSRQVPHTIRHAEKWELTLRDEEGNTGTVRVNRATFNSIDEGDYYAPKTRKN